MNPIRILLVDDHQIFLDGLTMLLEDEPDIQKVDEVLDGDLALKIMESEPIDIVVLDIDMPRLNGIETAKAIIEKFPSTKVLILTMHKTKVFIEELVKIGANGYLLKNRGKEEFIRAIRKIASGKNYYGEDVIDTLISNIRDPKEDTLPRVKITAREKEVLKLIVDGLSTPQIAEKLFIANSTVESHRRNLIDKTEVSNSKSLIRYALQNGLLD